MKKTALALTLILAISFLAVASTHFANLGRANFAPPPLPRIYIRNDGSISPLNASIVRVGDVYTFADNITDFTIEVERDNIVIDGQGFTLQKSSNDRIGNGIKFDNRNNVTIRNLNIKSYVHGIEMVSNYESSQLNTGVNIINNSITDCMTGIWFQGAINDSISGNKILNNDQGIKMEQNSLNTINGNVIMNNGGGINLVSSDYNTFMLNTISENEEGIRIGISQGNIFTGNDITHNDFSILFESLFTPSNDNLFYNNNFINNSNPVYQKIIHDVLQPQNNIWDNGTRGNYWSDYSTIYPNATEIGHSGIGDTPYVINANNIDNYPFMAPVKLVQEFTKPNEESNQVSEPFPIVLVIATVAAVTVVGIGLLVYFKKRKR